MTKVILIIDQGGTLKMEGNNMRQVNYNGGTCSKDGIRDLNLSSAGSKSLTSRRIWKEVNNEVFLVEDIGVFDFDFRKTSEPFFVEERVLTVETVSEDLLFIPNVGVLAYGCGFSYDSEGESLGFNLTNLMNGKYKRFGEFKEGVNFIVDTDGKYPKLYIQDKLILFDMGMIKELIEDMYRVRTMCSQPLFICKLCEEIVAQMIFHKGKWKKLPIGNGFFNSNVDLFSSFVVSLY